MTRWSHTLVAAMLVAGLSTVTLAADQDQQQGAEAQPAGSQIQAGQQGAQGQAQTAAGQDPAAQGQAMSPEKMFIKHAALDGMKEVQLAQIAQQNASDQQVKQLAQKIQQDHQKANEQLKQIAQKQGVDAPQQLPQEKQEQLQYFQSLQGKQFDQEYVCAVKAGHAADISMFQDKAKTLQDEQLKQWVQQQLPTLKQHQQMAMAASGPLGLDTTGSMAAGSGTNATLNGEDARPAGERIPGSTDSQQGTDINGSSPQTPSTPGQTPGSSGGTGSSGSGATGSGTGGSGSSSSGSGTGSSIGQ